MSVLFLEKTRLLLCEESAAISTSSQKKQWDDEKQRGTENTRELQNNAHQGKDFNA